MLGTQNLLLFVATGILLNLTPGQDTFYILGRSVVRADGPALYEMVKW